MDVQTNLAILMSFLISSLLKGITGLGFSTLCLPILSSFLEPSLSIPVVILPSLTSNLLVMAQAQRWRESMRRFWLLYLGAIPGLILGVRVLSLVDGDLSRQTLGGVILCYGIWALRAPSLTLDQRWERGLAGPVGMVTGLVNGMTGSQVMPVLPFMLSLPLEREVLVFGINLSFTCSSLIMILLLGRLGWLTPQILGLSVVGILPVMVGIRVGGRWRRSLNETRYRQLVLGVLLGIGLSLILRH